MDPDYVAHLRAAGCSLVLDCQGERLPRVAYWGRDLGELSQPELRQLVHGLTPQLPTNTIDQLTPFSLLPEHSAGWLGSPGLSAHRDGADFSTAFTLDSLDRSHAADGSQSAVARASDADAGVGLALELEMTPSGLIRQRATVTNTDAEQLCVNGVLLTFPVPQLAAELLDLTGRHLRERSPQRHDFTLGTHLRENRRGRTGTDATLVLAAGEPGFGFRHGQVWGVHTAWSGNHRTLAEATPGGVRFLGGGESLLPGEIRLAAGDTYTTPWVYASHGDGLDQMSARFHEFLRARPQHPTSARPVTMNTWEAVYFDHDLPRLTALADAAAQVGVERFVLDDGWFQGRRDDTAGLGDWLVDGTVWPDGLHPLAEHVRGLGMQFGLWVEPEMVNPDSDLARAHPDWVMSPGHRMPPAARHQQVLDLARPEAYGRLLRRLDALLNEYPIGYLKWDHNRDLIDAGSSVSGAPGVHAQTLATYRLMDELRRRHPGLEIESCSSGGGRVDLAVLDRTDRVWASDCIDPLERQQIQRWTGLLLPPEMIGCHVGAPTAHTTGRTHTLDFRAGTAFFGHFGIEWDLTAASPEELGRLAQWITAHKAARELLHSGVVARGDHPDPAVLTHGVVAPDRSRAIYAIAQVATSVQSPPGQVRLPGLDPDATYHVAPLPPGDRFTGSGQSALDWWADGVRLPGRVLAQAGVQAPILHPETMVLLQAVRE